MATQLSIFQGAYSELVGGVLASVNARPGRVLLANWNTVRITALTLQRWPWTVLRADLVRQRSDAPDYQYMYPFSPTPKPIGAGPLAVYDGSRQRVPPGMWALRGGFIFTDSMELAIEYQYDSNPGDWPDQFAEYVRLRLCEATAVTYTGSIELRQDFTRKAEDAYDRLTAAVAEVLPPQTLFDGFQTTQSRYGGLGYRPVILNADGQAAG